jgi:hypothetical protein
MSSSDNKYSINGNNNASLIEDEDDDLLSITSKSNKGKLGMITEEKAEAQDNSSCDSENESSSSSEDEKEQQEVNHESKNFFSAVDSKAKKGHSSYMQIQ